VEEAFILKNMHKKACLIIIIIIIIIPGQCLWCCHHDSRDIARVHPVHAMNAE